MGLSLGCRGHGPHHRSDVGMIYLAGRMDAEGTWKNGRRIIIDIKTGKQHDWHHAQLNTYRHLREAEFHQDGNRAPEYDLGVAYLSLENGFLEPVEVEPLAPHDPGWTHFQMQDPELAYLPSTHEYYLFDDKGQQKIMGVSEYLKRMKIAPEYKPSKTKSPFAAFGTGIHEWIEALHRGEDIETALKGTDEETADVIRIYLSHWQKILQRHDISITAMEQTVWGKKE